MKRLQTFIKQHYPAMILSFSIPVLLMIIAYYSIDIYPGSERSILATDSFAQYSNFHASFKNVLQGKQSIFYTWSGSLGLNYWSLMAYYLNGIFTPLVALFDNAAMPDTIYYLTLLKFGASGLSFWFFAQHTFKINRWLTVGLSVSYALMSYAVSYSPVIMWLDTFLYLPLIVWGIHRLMDQKKPTLLFVSYLLLFLSNFYMAFMVGVFTFLYAFIRTTLDWKRYKGRFVSYLITSFLAGGASMITILPTIMDLSYNGESLNEITSLLTPDTGVWDLIAKSMVGVYDTSKYESMPFVYIGLVPVIFCLFYFLSGKIPLKNKLGYGSLMLLVIASVYIYPLNLFWHGMHAPNMFLFRFSFLLSFLVILLAGYGLEQFSKEESNRLVNGILGIGAVFLVFLYFSNKKRYDVITTESLVLTIGLLLAYLLIWLFWISDSKWKKWVPVLLLILMFGEAGINAKAMISGVLHDWGYPPRSYYTESYDDIETLVGTMGQEETAFFRSDIAGTDSLNSSFNFGTHGVSMFSSIRNRHSSQYLNALGFRSLGTNLTIEYKNNTLLADTLIGMKYNLTKGEVNKFGYKKVAESGEYSLYENQYAMPLGVLTDEAIYGKDAVANQTELFNHLSGMDGELFAFGEAALIRTENAIVTEEEKTITISEKEPNLTKRVTWMVTVPAKMQAYLSLVPANWSEANGVTVKLTINGEAAAETSKLVNTGQYYDLGYYEETTTVEVEVGFSDGDASQSLSLYRPDAVYLDTERFAEAAEKIQEQGVAFQTEGRRAKASVDLEEEQVLLTTIPYDRGWKVLIDGEEAEVTTFKDAFLSVKIPAGAHEIEFVFLPQGFAVGAVLFVSCILCFSVYVWWGRRKQLMQEEKEKSEESI